MAAESWWCWPLSAWLSSGTACFLFFNAVVCVVAVLSWGRGGGDATLSTKRKRLTRSASSMVMERLRSMSTIFSFQYSAAEYDSITPQLRHVQAYYYTTSQEGGGEEMRQAEPEPAEPVVESMTATMAPPTPSMPVAAAAAAAAEVCAAASTEESKIREEMSRQALEPTPTAAAAAARPRKWKVAGTVERRAFAEMEEKAEVNARAERFIRQFREDLKLERLNSIITRKC